MESEMVFYQRDLIIIIIIKVIHHQILSLISGLFIIQMSFLNTLLQDISQSCQMQRGNSVGYRSRYLFDSAYQQVGCQQATSRSLSSKKSSKKESGEEFQTRVKACFKILHTMNKKFRTIKYFVFIKLEEMRSQMKPVLKEAIEEVKKQDVCGEIFAVKGKQTNLNTREPVLVQQKLNKIKQTMKVMFEKYYAASLKQQTFSKLRKNFQSSKKIEVFQQILDLTIHHKIRQSYLLAINKMKQLAKKADQVDLFAQMLNCILRKIAINHQKYFFTELSSIPKLSYQSSSSEFQTIVINKNQKDVFRTPPRTLPSTTKAQQQQTIDYCLQRSVSNNCFQTIRFQKEIKETNQQFIYSKAQPFCFESLSSLPTISYQLEQKSYSFRGKSSEHVPIQLNKLYQDNIVFEVYDVGESKLFSVNQMTSSNLNVVSTVTSYKTFNNSKNLQLDDQRYWEKSKELFSSSESQYVYQRQKVKQNKSFFVNESAKRPVSNFINSSNPNRKLNLTYNPQHSSDNLYSHAQKLKIASQLHSKRQKTNNITPKTSVAGSQFLQSQDIKPRNSLKNPTFNGQPKKIALIPKFRLPCDKSRNI